jgi:hypothetical protein
MEYIVKINAQNRALNLRKIVWTGLNVFAIQQQIARIRAMKKPGTSRA